MKTKEHNWNIFICGSGDFNSPECRVAVAALGLRADRYLTRPSNLKAAICSLAPTLPWPLHMCVTDRVAIMPMMLLCMRMRAAANVAGKAYRVVGRILSDLDEGRQPSNEDLKVLETRIAQEYPCPPAVPVKEFVERYRKEWKYLLNEVSEQHKHIDVPLPLWADPLVFSQPNVIATAANHLIKKDESVVMRVVQALVHGNEPESKDLERLERLLEEVTLLTSLTSANTRVHAAFCKINRVLARPDETGLPGAFVSIASDSNVGDYYPPGDGTDRYLSLLEALLTRVAEVVSRWPGKHVLRLYVTGQEVLDPIIGGPYRIPLHIRHVGEFKGRIVSRLKDASSVRLVPIDVQMTTELDDPRFVFAKFLASVGQYAAGDRSLRSFERLVHIEFGILPRFGDPSRTHIQAGGSAWVLLEALKSGMAPPDLPMWPWALEQAMEWGAV